MADVGDSYRRANDLMKALRALIDSGTLERAPEAVLDAVARAVGDLARLRSGSESDLLSAIAFAAKALDGAERWRRKGRG